MNFNPHNNVTSDGILITEGLRVFTNELAVGVVTKDRDANGYSCCATHGAGQVRIDGAWFTDHEADAKLECRMGCRHNHWFDVAYDDEATTPGNRKYVGSGAMMDGERLTTRFEGRLA